MEIKIKRYRYLRKADCDFCKRRGVMIVGISIEDNFKKLICFDCYKQNLQKRCDRCGETRQVKSSRNNRVICERCYRIEYHHNPDNHKQCIVCEKVKPICSHGACYNCYEKQKRKMVAV